MRNLLFMLLAMVGFSTPAVAAPNEATLLVTLVQERGKEMPPHCNTPKDGATMTETREWVLNIAVGGAEYRIYVLEEQATSSAFRWQATDKWLAISQVHCDTYGPCAERTVVDEGFASKPSAAFAEFPSGVILRQFTEGDPLYGVPPVGAEHRVYWQLLYKELVSELVATGEQLAARK